MKECVKDCSVAVFVNDHDEYKKIALEEIVNEMDKEKRTIFDLYNNYSMDKLNEQKVKVFKLGEYDDTI